MSEPRGTEIDKLSWGTAWPVCAHLRVVTARLASGGRAGPPAQQPRLETVEEEAGVGCRTLPA